MDPENNGTIAFARDVNDLCRVCLSSDENGQCIFRVNVSNVDPTDDNVAFYKQLEICGGIQIFEGDGLPSNICTKCISKIHLAHQLRRQCQKADVTLRKILGKPFFPKDKDRNENRDLDEIHGIPSLRIKDEYSHTEESSTSNNPKHSFAASNTCHRAEGEGDSPLDIVKENIIDFQYDFNSVKTNDSSPDAEDHLEDKPKDHSENTDKPPTSKREAYRTRRTSMFKRMTSMENLRNHKERQRQYIKKNANPKHDASENCATSENSDLPQLAHKCPKCSRSFATKKSLDRHSLSHEKELRCGKCDKLFFSAEKLADHSKLHQTKEKPDPVRCRICDKNFRKMDTMVRHLNIHKRANPKEVFSILKEIRDRRKRGDQPEPRERDFPEVGGRLESGNSNSESSSDSESPENSGAIVGSSHRCKHCSKSYSSEKSLQRHLRVHEEKRFVCSVCNMKFFRQDRLKSHRERYGHVEDRVCPEPQKPPDDKSAIKLINSWIREELDSDNEGKGFPCEVCGKSYDTKKSLSKHQSNVHGSREEFQDEGEAPEGKGRSSSGKANKAFACDECGKSFEKEAKLQKHARIHERAREQQDANFKRFLCHICSKTFRQNTGLMFHMRTHTGYKPHVCKYCGRGFTSNSNCINHERTHTGDRPFVCHFCSAAFAKSCTLKAHITTHTGEANYHCKTCGKSFRRLKYLKEHRFTHTGEKPYACKICGTAYSHSGSLFVHEKKCKAQYSSYQNTTASFCAGQSTGTTQIVPGLNQNLNNTLGVQMVNKGYGEGLQRMNVVQHGACPVAVHPVGMTVVHPDGNSEVEMATAVRSFAIIGQVFHS